MSSPTLDAEERHNVNRKVAFWAALVAVTAVGGLATLAQATGLRGAAATGTASNPAARLTGHLLFTRTQGNDVQTIFLASGSEERRLTEPGSYCCLLRISPDHTKILVMPGGDIPPPLTGGTINLSGSGFKRLPVVDPTLNLIPQAWSPDGKRIAFAGWDDSDSSRTGVYTARAADGKGLQRVTARPGPLLDVPLDYSPDGKWLVIYRSVGVDPDPQVGGSLWVVRTNGSGLHQIADASARPDAWARWSKTGDRILFANERLAPVGAIWTVRSDGSRLHRVFADKQGRFPINPVWSPDGNHILFALDPTNDRFTHPNNSLWQMDADGTHPQLVIDSADFKSQMEWWR
jgi:Tol biopolymer transport system component